MRWSIGFLGLAAVLFCNPRFSAAQGARCHAAPDESKKTVPWASSTGEIQFSSDQLDCKPEAPGVPWIAVSLQPPLSNGQRIFKFSYAADTNLSSQKRQGKITLGDSEVVIEQEGGPPPSLSYTPSRMEFTYDPGKDKESELKKPLFVGSSEALVFSAKPDPVKWMTVKPQHDAATAQKQQSFLVTVNADRLAPGVYKANISLEAAGASNPQESVPVVLRVGPVAGGQ